MSLRIIFFLSVIAITALSFKPTPEKKVVIGYVAGYNGVINTTTINATQLTHINYAFVDIRDTLTWLHNEATDTVNFRKLNKLKQQNADLKILISIGGWSWSKNFSDAMLTTTSRKAFAKSAVDIIHAWQLDGIDIDWEYPNMQGDNNTYRAVDKQNYTLMFMELRSALDVLTQRSRKKYLLTTAVGAFPAFIANTEMDKAQQYLDYINLMTYDYSWGVSGHHSNLYPSQDYNKENSAHKAVTDFMNAGVPAAKLVIGLAFYGRGGFVTDTTGNGLHHKLASSKGAGGYTYLRDSLVNKKGFIRYWDEQAGAPYLFNKNTGQFISYDDERSVTGKCNYVLEKQLGGVMFWEYSSDLKGYLLSAITTAFDKK